MKRSLRSWLWRVPLDREVEEEIAFHVEMRTRELIKRGTDPETARATAIRRLGDVDSLKRTCIDLGRKRDREMRLTQWIDEARHDVKYAVRQLRGSPTFTAVAVLTLTLGVSVNSAIFALANATVIQPLPYQAPDRLMKLSERLRSGFLSGPAPLDFVDWSERNSTFEAMAAILSGGRAMTGADGIAEQVPSQTVSARFFDVLGVKPIAGRTFLPADETPSPNVVVLSEGFWRARFAGDPSVVGREITLDGQPITVIGIVPADFQMLLPAGDGIVTAAPSSLWALIAPPPRGNPVLRSAHYYQVIGRLKPGVTLEMARADMTTIAQGIARTFPDTHKDRGAAVEPLRDVLIGPELRLTSTLLLGVVAFVLLLCCANVANLLLARTAVRGRELAVRSALGAGRRRIVAQLLTESLVLAGLGGVTGTAVGAAILKIAPSVVPPGLLPGAVTLEFDGRVVAFCVVTTLAVGVVFGLVPAWRGTRISLVQVITSDGRTVTGRGTGFRRLVVAAEVAAAVLLLCGAGLLLRTFVNLAGVDPGYRAHDVLTMAVTLPSASGSSRYPTSVSMRQFYEAVEQEIGRVGGVQSVGWGSALPLDGSWFGQTFQVAGDPPTAAAGRNSAMYQIVSPSYFTTLGISLRQGRSFTDSDRAESPPVCVVDEAFVRRYLGGRQPVGIRVAVPLLSLRPSEPPIREIVGVIQQVKLHPNETQAQPTIYVPLAQNSWWTASLVVRPTVGRAEELTRAVRAAVARVDKDLPVTRVRTMSEVGREATSRWRFRAVLVGTFAVLALVLAMVGVFGVLAYSVQQRTREFGVRIALGASVPDVMRLVLTSAVRMTAIGAAIGLVCAGVLSRSIATLLFGVPPLDPVTFGAAATVLLVTAAVAAAAPALRAARIDPIVTLRNE
jgi:putative ABC transport system permease protein